MFMAPSLPPPWMGWALRPRPTQPCSRHSEASPQPAPSLPTPQSMVNTKPEQVEEESEEVREQKHKTFVEKYEKQIKHFGELGAERHQWGPEGLALPLGPSSTLSTPCRRHAPPLG